MLAFQCGKVAAVILVIVKSRAALKEVWLFGTCCGKHMFFDRVLARHKAMREKRYMADIAEKRGELIQVFLMR